MLLAASEPRMPLTGLRGTGQQPLRGNASSVYGENPFLEVPAQSRLDICRCNIKQSAKATAFYEDLMSKPSSTIWMDIHSIYYIKYIFIRFSEFLFKVHASLCVPRWQADRM